MSKDTQLQNKWENQTHSKKWDKIVAPDSDKDKLEDKPEKYIPSKD